MRFISCSHRDLIRGKGISKIGQDFRHRSGLIRDVASDDQLFIAQWQFVFQPNSGVDVAEFYKMVGVRLWRGDQCSDAVGYFGKHGNQHITQVADADQDDLSVDFAG